MVDAFEKVYMESQNWILVPLKGGVSYKAKQVWILYWQQTSRVINLRLVGFETTDWLWCNGAREP